MCSYYLQVLCYAQSWSHLLVWSQIRNLLSQNLCKFTTAQRWWKAKLRCFKINSFHYTKLIMGSHMNMPERVTKEEWVSDRLLPVIYIWENNSTTPLVTQDMFSMLLFPSIPLSIFQQALSTLPWNYVSNPCTSAITLVWGITIHCLPSATDSKLGSLSLLVAPSSVFFTWQSENIN